MHQEHIEESHFSSTTNTPLQFSRPQYLYNAIIIQPPCSIHMIFILDEESRSFILHLISVTSQNHKPFFLTCSTSVIE